MPLVCYASDGQFRATLSAELSRVVDEAHRGFESARAHWSHVHTAAREDLDFLSDKEGAQWDGRDFDARRRKNRPCLTIDQLTQFVNQVSNDVRMNTPSVDVRPHSGGADMDTAEIFQGIIRDIEHNSNADDAYDYAVNSAVKCSLGFIRVDHRYKDEHGFEQELFIERVVNPFSVYLDPTSVSPDGSDAMFAWVIDSLAPEAFKDRFDGFDPVSFEGEASNDLDSEISICEYFKVEEEKITLAKLPDGSVQEYVAGMDVVDTRPSVRRVVRRYLLSGQDVLEETTFPGRYIPVIPVYGEEAWNNGKRNLHSLIRKAKDSQRRYNYWASTEAEMLMKAPKATIIAVGGTTENYAEDYKNPDRAIVLRYDQTDSRGQPAPPPQLNPGPGVPVGIIQARQCAADDIKATMGLYNAFIGQRGNETSGVAIQQRKMEGDRAVYHYGDNLVRSITQMGRVLVSAIPEIYSEPRVIRIIGKEENADEVGINGAMVEGQERPFYLSRGQYSVRVTTGAAYATQREEAAEFFQQVIQSQPQLIEVAGDLLFKFMDFPGAQALSERMKRLIPHHILDEQNQDPQTQALANENEQLKQAIAQMQAEGQALQQELKNKQVEIAIKAKELESKSEESRVKAEIEIAKLQLDERKIALEMEIKQAELALKAQEMALREQEAAAMASGANAQTVLPQSSGYEQGEN